MSEIRMSAASGNRPAEVFIYDESYMSFFEMFSARQLRMTLDSLDGEPVVFRISSYGGDPYAAMTMHTVIKEYPGETTAIVDGIAASSASLIACATDTLEMKAGTQLMIHEPSMRAEGTSDDLSKASQRLATMRESAAEVYADRTGKSRESILRMMADETWMSPEEARNEGFANTISRGETVQMCATPEMVQKFKFRNLPESLLTSGSTETPSEGPTMSKETPGEGSAAATAVPQAVSMTAEQIGLMVNSAVEKAVAAVTKSNEPSPEMLAKQEERKRVSNISAICMKAGFTQEEINKFVDDDSSLETVQMAVIEKLQSTNRPADEGGQGEADKTAPFAKEYDEAVNGGVEMSCSRDEYIRSRCETEGVKYEKKGE